MHVLFICWCFFVFFFFKQKTAYEMRISDWSSDVCSSDLAEGWPDRTGRQSRRALSPAGDEICRGLPGLANDELSCSVQDRRGQGGARGRQPAAFAALRQWSGSHRRQDRKSTRLNSSH